MAGETGGADAGGPSPKPPSSARYIIFVGVAFAALIAVATISTLGNPSNGLLGVNADVKERALPEFAIPDVRSTLVGDANVFQDDCSSSQNPCPAGGGRPSACQVHLAGAIRICDFFDRPLVISFWFIRGASCLPAQDAFDQVARRYGDRVGFLSIDIRDNRDEVRRLAAEHHWTVPVGWDQDGAVSDLYRVGGCPTVALAYPGGIYAAAPRASIDTLTVPKLSADIRKLLADTRRRAAASR